MDPSHTQGHAEESESVRIQCWCHSDSYSVWGNAKFVSPMYKHTPMQPFLLWDCRSMQLVSRSQTHSPERGNAFLRRSYVAPIAKPSIAS